MRIVVDAMGSDKFPEPDVAGGVEAARTFGDTIILVGDETRIRQELAKHATTGLKIEVVHAANVVTMDDKPSIVGKSKPNSSMHVGMNLIKHGQADGFVTAGNTGAALSIATLYTLHRISGVKRPALSAVMKLPQTSVVLLDVGANADSKPEWLAQFALMGKIYAQNALNRTQPRIGILSNGEEAGKGSQLVQEASALIQAMPLNFVGNVEPKDVLKAVVDVVVIDGFVGNIFIKGMEAATSMMSTTLRESLTINAISKLGALLSRSAFTRVRQLIDPFEVGGAPLLGVNGVVIIGHGRSNAKAIKNAVGQARSAVNGRVIDTIRDGLAAAIAD